MQLRTGLRLGSRVCTTEVIVIKAPAQPVDLRCGGEPMRSILDDRDPTASVAAGLDGGSVLGKRYVSDVSGAGRLELLVTKSGAGTLTVAAEPLELAGVKPLPASD